MIKVKGFNQYVVSKQGDVYRLPVSRPMVPGTFTNGYKYIRLTKNGKRTNALLHRIIANAFIKNPMKKAFINHINGIKSDNQIENLEWCSRSENMIHCINVLKKSNRKTVLNIKTGVIYKSIKSAAKEIGMNTNTLQCQLMGRNKNTTNYAYTNK